MLVQEEVSAELVQVLMEAVLILTEREEAR
jgi:hypothetical protein